MWQGEWPFETGRLGELLQGTSHGYGQEDGAPNSVLSKLAVLVSFSYIFLGMVLGQGLNWWFRIYIAIQELNWGLELISEDEAGTRTWYAWAEACI